MLDASQVSTASAGELSTGARVLFSRTPVVLHRRTKSFLATPDATVLDIVADLFDRYDLPDGLQGSLRVDVEGTVIPRHAWGRVRPKSGVRVNIYPVVQDDATSILASVAMIIVAAAAIYFAPYLSVAILGYTTAAAEAVIAGVITTIGALAISMLFVPRNLSGELTTEAIPQSNFLFGTANAQPRYGTVPRVYGKRRITPNLAAIPYTSPMGQSNQLTAIYDCGYGPLEITDIRIGDQPIDGDNQVQYEVHEEYVAGDPLSYYKRERSEIPTQTPLSNQWERLDGPSGETDIRWAIVELVFPRGFFDGLDRNGTEQPGNQQIIIQVLDLEIGGTWQQANITRGSKNPGKVYSISDNKIVFDGVLRGSYAYGFYIRFPYDSRWAVRMIVNNMDDEDEYKFVQPTWVSLKTVSSNPPIAPRSPRTIIEIQINSSEEYSNRLQQLTCVAESKLRGITSDGPNPDVTTRRNPAVIFLDVLTGIANQDPIPDDMIDWETLNRWQNYCNEQVETKDGDTQPRARFDYVVDSKTTVWQLLTMVAGQARAAPTIKDGLLSVAFDDPTWRTTPEVKQVFTERNASDYSATRRFSKQPDAYRVTWIDPEQEWQTVEFYLGPDGTENPTLNSGSSVEQIDFPAITRFDHAFREARYQIAQIRLRPETHRVSVMLEHLLVTRGDVVSLSMESSSIGGVPSRIVGVIQGGTDTTILLDTPHQSAAADRIVLRTNTGTSAQLDIYQAPDAFTLVFDDPDLDVSVGDLIVAGGVAQPVNEYIVLAISPGADESAQLSLADLSPDIYDEDDKPIGEYAPVINNPDRRNVGDVRNLLGSSRIVFLDRSPFAEVTLSWQRSKGGERPVGYNVWWRAPGDEDWVLLLVTADNRVVISPDRFRLNEEDDNLIFNYRPGGFAGLVVDFKVVAIDAFGETSRFSSAPIVSITMPRDDVIPGDVESFDANIRANTLFFRWSRVPEKSVAGYQIRWARVETPWADMQPVGSFLSHDQDQVELPGRQGWYGIKAVDTSGNRSAKARFVFVQTEWREDYDRVLDEIEPFPGSHGIMEGTVISAAVAGTPGLHLAPEGGEPFTPPEYLDAGLVARQGGTGGSIFGYDAAGGDYPGSTLSPGTFNDVEISTFEYGPDLATSLRITAAENFNAEQPLLQVSIYNTVVYAYPDAAGDYYSTRAPGDDPDVDATYSEIAADDGPSPILLTSVDSYAATWTAERSAADEFGYILNDSGDFSEKMFGSVPLYAMEFTADAFQILLDAALSYKLDQINSFGVQIDDTEPFIVPWDATNSRYAALTTDPDAAAARDYVDGLVPDTGGAAFAVRIWPFYSAAPIAPARAVRRRASTLIARRAVRASPGEFVSVRTYGRYEFDSAVDMGEILEPLRLTADIEAEGYELLNGAIAPSDQWDVRVEFRTADSAITLTNWRLMKSENGDGISIDIDLDGAEDYIQPFMAQGTLGAWSAWSSLTMADVRARLVQFRLVLMSDYDYITPVVTKATVRVDVPERVEKAYDVQVPAAGLLVTYDRGFREPPAVNLTLDDASPGDFVVISQRTKRDFLVEIKDSSGANIAGQVDWSAAGWGRLVA